MTAPLRRAERVIAACDEADAAYAKALAYCSPEAEAERRAVFDAGAVERAKLIAELREHLK